MTARDIFACQDPGVTGTHLMFLAPGLVTVVPRETKPPDIPSHGTLCPVFFSLAALHFPGMHNTLTGEIQTSP